MGTAHRDSHAHKALVVVRVHAYIPLGIHLSDETQNLFLS
jgi:hypothetical protein